jgi:hypothetical protein
VSANPRWQRLLWWLLGAYVPTLGETNRAPSFRWAWTGRFEDARKLGPDIADGIEAALSANREALADLDGVQRAIDSGDIDAVLAAAAKAQLSQETYEAALRLHPFRDKP